MAFLKRWKTNWELKSLTFDQLFSVIVKVITKQLDEIEEDSVKLEANLVIDYEADSVDIVAMLLYLEDMFKNASQTTRTVVPTDKLGQIVLVEDILDIMYEVLVSIESKMETFVQIKPDFDTLEKQKKVGELYPGTLSTISFDSFNPKPVTLRTIFKIAIFLSAGTSVKRISKAVFSSTASTGAAATGAKPPIVGVATDVSTPNVSSIAFTNSAASKRVKVFNCSRIRSNFSFINKNKLVY